MSQPFRHPTGMQPTLGNRTMTPMSASRAPNGVPVLPNAYGLVAAQPHQYVVHPPFQQNIASIPTNMRMPVFAPVPNSMPGLYVPVSLPVAPMNPTMRAQSVDPSKLLEEQKRIEKERNFQLQQLRLKQFTVAGKKGSMNAENLIDNMFGKVQPKPSRTASPSMPNFESSEPAKPSIPVTENPTIPEVSIAKQELQFNVPVKQPKKELDDMMRECSELSGSQKANTFSKPSVKELTTTTSKAYTFTASNKSRDWKNVQGLDEVFVAPKPRFPEWCNQQKIPEIYRQIEAHVTNNGSHPPDTKLVFPILVSSGLPQQTLGQIWELVNQSSPGNLTVEEMYAALALIAVTQAGHPVKTADILHQLPACPIPQLQCFSSPSQSRVTNELPTNVPPQMQTPMESSVSPAVTAAATLPTDAPTHKVLRPSAISLMAGKQQGAMQNVSTTKLASGFTSSPDDEFDDFKSATPTAINFSIGTPTSNWSDNNNDDFDDFKQAPPLNSSSIISSDTQTNVGMAPPPNISLPASSIKNNIMPPAISSKQSVPDPIKNETVIEPDLMSPEEDKYSVFRSLQPSKTEDSSDWCDFSSFSSDIVTAGIPPSQVDESSQMNKPTVLPSEGNNFLNFNPPVKVTEEDEFGDFLCAEAITTNSQSSINFSNRTSQLESELKMPPPASVTAVTSQFEGLSTNFADFNSFKDTSDEFGDFACSFPTNAKAELSHDFLSIHAKDNISLSESQSVSSLELGTFDGGGHSGESKSSLSRQGSIPSLDLKQPVFLENNDNDDFGEFQSIGVVGVASKSPSPASDIKLSEPSIPPAPIPVLTFQPTQSVSLVDKYSVIRDEERKEEDQHISCWMRCLQNSVGILQNTKKIFNQMSCSSVCNEVLKSEEGENYIKDVIEVYKIVRRIAVASKSAGKQTPQMLDLFKEAEQAWNTVCGFFAGTSLMPEESSLEFSNAILSSNSDDNTKACGVCLLNIDFKTKNSDETLQLSYGGRNYHSTCANLWVNCVDPLLPALSLSQLL